jgi:hypothetical protein
MCDVIVHDVLANDERSCTECGHRWMPDEVLERL